MKTHLFMAALCMGMIAHATPSQALFIIDDYNTATTYSALDNSPGDGPVTTNATPITAGNIVWGVAGGGAGATRTIVADLGAGDDLAANVCSNCQEGEHVSGNNSIGNTAFVYNGNSVDVSSYTHLMLRYDADLLGGIVQFTFDDALANVVSVATGVLGARTTEIMLGLPAGVDFSQLTSARIDITGVTELDVGIDDFRLTRVPEPAALGLFGLGLAGLFHLRRRRAI